MTRDEAIHKLHATFGTLTAVDLVNHLQEHALISDNVGDPKADRPATCDLVNAVAWCRENPERFHPLFV